MKKIMLVLAAFAALSMGAFAQDLDSDINEISLTKEDSPFHADLHLAAPMYFGTSVLVNPTNKGAWAMYDKIQEMQTGKNFVYGLEMASVHFFADGSPLDISLGLRWTFMDFTFKDSSITLREAGDYFVPVPIKLENAGYDGKKSKIHANYLGIPLRFSFQADDFRAFVGASAEYLVSGYTKYRNPKFRQGASGIFNSFRATVEAGVTYKSLGFFVNYGLTPLFPEALSDARTLTFGVVLGK